MVILKRLKQQNSVYNKTKCTTHTFQA